MDWNKQFNIKRANMLEASKSIRETFADHQLDFKDFPWLNRMVEEVEFSGNGNPTPIHPKNLIREQWLRFGTIIAILTFAKDLKTCSLDKVDLHEKLRKAKSISHAASAMHEIHTLACLLRAGYDAEFINESALKTPDIDVKEIGYIECKTATSKGSVMRGINRGIKQLALYKGITFVDVLLYFPISGTEVKELIKHVIFQVTQKFTIDPPLHGFGLTFYDPHYATSGDMRFGILTYGQPLRKLTVDVTQKLILAVAKNKQ